MAGLQSEFYGFGKSWKGIYKGEKEDELAMNRKSEPGKRQRSVL